MMDVGVLCNEGN